MAVDVKTLRIGSHVQHHGKRKMVYSMGGDTVYLLPSIVSSVAHVAKTDEIEPIPITPGLLKELGFEEKRTEYLYGAPDVWYIDSESAQLEKENNLVVPTIHVSSLGKAGYTDWWVIKVITGDKPMRSDNCTVRYLHEAEAFLALHGVELIKE